MMNLFCILAGGFTIVMAVMNDDWYFNNSKARLWVSIFGREGARWGLGILGAFIIGLGLFTKL